MFQWWVGFADESGVGEEANAWVVTNPPPPIGKICKWLVEVFQAEAVWAAMLINQLAPPFDGGQTS